MSNVYKLKLVLPAFVQYLISSSASSMKRCEPLRILGINSGSKLQQ